MFTTHHVLHRVLRIACGEGATQFDWAFQDVWKWWEKVDGSTLSGGVMPILLSPSMCGQLCGCAASMSLRWSAYMCTKCMSNSDTSIRGSLARRRLFEVETFAKLVAAMEAEVWSPSTVVCVARIVDVTVVYLLAALKEL